MFVNIEAKRLLLKCVDQGDREFIFEEFQNDFINKYLYDEEPMTDIEQADDLIDFYNMKEPRNQNRWVLINPSCYPRALMLEARTNSPTFSSKP